MSVPNIKGGKIRRPESNAQDAHVDEDVEYSHSKDAERGDFLVNRRALLNDEKERKNLFHRQCKCNGNVCNVVIDGDSTDNLIFEEIITKLNLERRRHPNPYQITWLQKDHKALVNEQHVW